VLHLLLPEGETWFVEVFKRALPLVRDDALREDVLGFIGQEAIHASAHQGVLDYYATQGVDTSAYIKQIEWLFHRILGETPGLTEAGKREELIEHVAVVAAIEHFTAALGGWVLDATALDAANAHPVMVDLLRWHGSEEVEHRNVAYDLMVHLDPGYIRRIRPMFVVALVLPWLWARGALFFGAADHGDPACKMNWRGYLSAARRGLLPGPVMLIKVGLQYFRPRFHPSQYLSTQKCVAYLATSPAARAAAR
jgi:predicted metal-dependent hydrolase